MNDDNLLFHSDDPTAPPPEKIPIIGDVHTGSLYSDGWKNYCTSLGDVLCALIFFIDKTHTDENGNLCLEPVSFTLSIFNRETRNKPNAWRTLG